MVFYCAIMASFISHRQSRLSPACIAIKDTPLACGIPKPSPGSNTGAENVSSVTLNFSAGYELQRRLAGGANSGSHGQHIGNPATDCTPTDDDLKTVREILYEALPEDCRPKSA
jgi:hypothetical protein